MKRKAFIVLFGAVLLLMATALTEYLFYRQDENTWVERFESRLHEQERKADHLLATLRNGRRILSLSGFGRTGFSFGRTKLSEIGIYPNC